jgi:hypothetical protein
MPRHTRFLLSVSPLLLGIFSSPLRKLPSPYPQIKHSPLKLERNLKFDVGGNLADLVGVGFDVPTVRPLVVPNAQKHRQKLELEIAYQVQ